MHELSICLALLDQVQDIARTHGAERVERIVLQVGPLAGVEPMLLANAYPLAAAGTCAEYARLEIEEAPLRVRCGECGAESDATPNRLACPQCGSPRTRLVSGDQMLLLRVELELAGAEGGG